MKPIKTVTIDLNRPQRNVVQMVQGDTSRRVLVNLLLNGNPYDVSTDYDGTIVKGVQYIKANGIGGYYEETTTGDDAVTAGTNANQWIIAIDNHATDVPGFAECFVKFSTEDGYVLHSFPITLYVDQSAASGGTDPNEPYYQSASFLIAGNQAEKTSDMTSPVGVDENGKMWVAPDNSFTLEAKNALLDLLSHVAYIDQNGQDYYDALELALRAKLSYIVADYVQDRTVYTDDSLDVLKEGDDLIVTAYYDDGTHTDLSDSQYTLSGTLTAGTSTITVTYGGKTDTFDVTVTAPLYSIPDFAEQTVSSSGTVKVSKTNGVYTFAGTAAGDIFILPNGTASASKSNTTWFSSIDGKPIQNAVFEIDWVNPNAINATFKVKLGQSDATGNLASANFEMTANGSGQGGTTEYYNASYGYERHFSCLALQYLRASGSGAWSSSLSVSFKVRIFVDGVRYL